jgi:tetratricopeptide (TPR) repeat protein
MSYDLFISYSRRDNERSQVGALVEAIKASFLAFAGRELSVFFDVRTIQGMDDWRQKIQRSLRESHLFLAVLSPSYLASPYCRWEWEEYVRYEAMRQCLGEGVAPVFFVTLPDAAGSLTDRTVKDWIEEIRYRQTFDLRPWYDAGEKSLEQAHVKETLEKLHVSVRERLDRADRARRSPANLLRHNPLFVGRVRELTELRNALTKNKLGIVGARQPGVMATVQGVGGMGKTELALAYAHAFAWDYPGGRWQLRCEFVADLRVVLLQLAGPMGFEFTDEENKSLALGFERVLRELRRRERCLIVLDNVSDPSLLEPEYLDRLPRDGHVDLIATTRLAPASLPGSAQDQTFIAVDELPEEDALSLLRSHQPNGRFPNQNEDYEARRIARLLEGFTLAVETAAIYLGRHSGSDTCRHYREGLEKELLAESEASAGDQAVGVRHRERLLDRTLEPTFVTLSPEAIHLLRLASLLPADAIALPWLQAVGAQGVHAFRSAVDLLEGLRLFQVTELTESAGEKLLARMHRLVQEVAKKRWSDGLAGRERALLDHVRARARFLWNGWVQHENRWEIVPLTACADYWLERAGDDGPSLATTVGGPLRELGNLAASERLSRRAVERTSSDNPNYATRINNLAILLRCTKRMAEAELLYRQALAIRERLYGPDHIDVAQSLNNLAMVLYDTNRMVEAEPLLRRALAIHEASYGPDHPSVAVPLGNLASVLHGTNRLVEAEAMFRRALAIHEASFGPNHPALAIDLNNLASVLQEADRQSETEPLYRRALAIHKSSFGPNHHLVAGSLNNLASLLEATNRMAEAEPLYRESLAISETSLGQDHPDVACSLNNLGLLLQATNRRGEAEPLHRRALAIDEASYGPDHPLVEVRLSSLASLLRDTNRSAEAEPLYRRALIILLKLASATGGYHPRLQDAIDNYASVLAAMGYSLDKMRAELGEIGRPFGLSVQEAKPLDSTNIQSNNSLHELTVPGSGPPSADEHFRAGEECRRKEQWEQAISHFSAAIELNAQFAEAYFKRANIKLRLGQHGEAIADYTEANRLDTSNAKYLNNRGRAYFEIKQYDRAIADYDAALRIDPEFAVSYFNRGLAREAMRDHAGALADFAKSVELEPSNMTYRNQLDAAKHQRG